MPVLILLLIVLMILLLNVSYTYPRIRLAYRIAHNAKVHTGRFKVGYAKNPLMSLFILGDSGITGQGIANFYDSAGGRLASLLGTHYLVEYLNQAGMGKWIGDIDHEQISGKWDLAVLALGSNDLLHDGDFATFKLTLSDLLGKLKQHSRHVIVAGPGDIAESKIFPWWYRLILKQRQKKYARTIEKATIAIGGHYFNPLTRPDIFKHLGKDGLHLGLNGNHLFAEALWQKWLEWEDNETTKDGLALKEEEIIKVPVKDWLITS